MNPRTAIRFACPSSLALAACVVAQLAGGTASAQLSSQEPPERTARAATQSFSIDSEMTHREVPDDPWRPRPATPPAGAIAHRGAWRRGPYVSVQVNVDEFGNNIVGDAANEPSIAIDPTDPSRIVIGWQQFVCPDFYFRQAGVAYSHDAGQTWTFPGLLTPKDFGGAPVVDVDLNGAFYYVTIKFDEMRLFHSIDGGVTWIDPPSAVVSGFGDNVQKEWMTIDRTGGLGSGHIYVAWSAIGQFTRSTDGGQTFLDPIESPINDVFWGTLTIGLNGQLFLVDSAFQVVTSRNAFDGRSAPTFSVLAAGVLDGAVVFGGPPNLRGLLGQAWIAVDRSFGPTRGDIYVLASISRTTGAFDVMFARSDDGGLTWSDPVRINDDVDREGVWHWFGTMSIAPNGRIDVIWNDTRNNPANPRFSELFYSFSQDGGVTWSKNVAVSPVFDTRIGCPDQDTIGDYYDMVSDDGGANIAYAATFNGEQDVYFLRINATDCNQNGQTDAIDIGTGVSDDCNLDGVPDECQNDCNVNGVMDRCDVELGTSPDCNRNFIPDECDVDLDSDGTPDGCDDDIDGDGVPNDADVCLLSPVTGPRTDDGRPFSDTNRNCSVDLIDYARFRFCLVNSGPGATAPAQTCLSVFDYDGDGDVDMADGAGLVNVFATTP